MIIPPLFGFITLINNRYIIPHRYSNERLSANLPPLQVLPFENDTRIAEGYNSHLSYRSAGYSPAARPNNTTLVVKKFNIYNLFNIKYMNFRLKVTMTSFHFRVVIISHSLISFFSGRIYHIQ